MTELKVYADSMEKAHAEGRERPFDLDINFKDGVGEVLSMTNSRKQRGYISAYIKRGTMKLAPGTGSRLAEFVIGEVSWPEVCCDLEESIQRYCGAGQFVPQFNMKGRLGQITVIDLQE